MINFVSFQLEDDYSKFRKDRNLGSSHVQVRSAGRKPKVSIEKTQFLLIRLILALYST